MPLLLAHTFTDSVQIVCAPGFDFTHNEHRKMHAGGLIRRCIGVPDAGKYVPLEPRDRECRYTFLIVS